VHSQVVVWVVVVVRIVVVIWVVVIVVWVVVVHIHTHREPIVLDRDAAINAAIKECDGVVRTSSKRKVGEGLVANVLNVIVCRRPARNGRTGVKTQLERRSTHDKVKHASENNVLLGELRLQ
jgi:hypothetical protein